MRKPSVKLLRQLLREIGVKRIKFDIKQLQDGFMVELEHGTVNPLTNITDDDPILTVKIALAHLMEDAEYYKKLKTLNL